VKTEVKMEVDEANDDDDDDDEIPLVSDKISAATATSLVAFFFKI